MARLRLEANPKRWQGNRGMRGFYCHRNAERVNEKGSLLWAVAGLASHRFPHFGDGDVIVIHQVSRPCFPGQFQGALRLGTTRCTEPAVSALREKPAMALSADADPMVKTKMISFHLVSHSIVASH